MFSSVDSRLDAAGEGERQAKILLPDGPTQPVFSSVEKAVLACGTLQGELRTAAKRNNVLLRSDAQEIYKLSRQYADSPNGKMDSLLGGARKGIDLTKAAFCFVTKELERPVYSKQMDKLIRRIIGK